MLTDSATPTPEPTNTVYLLSSDPILQNVYFVLLFIAAIGAAVGVVVVAVKFVVNPLRKRWLERKQWRFEIVSSARYSNIVSPRSRTFPTVEIQVHNDSAVTLPKATLTSSNFDEPEAVGHDLPSDKARSLLVPLTEVHRRGRNSSEVVAADNWQLSSKITVTLEWEKARKKRRSKSWTFDVAKEVKGLRATY